MLLLNLPDISTLLCFFLFFIVAYHIIYNLYFHPLSHFPGPFLAKLTPLYDVYWFLYKKGGNVAMERYLHQKYGSIVRRTPNQLTFDDPKLLPIVYNRFADKGPAYDIFASTMGMLGIKKHRDHAARRKMIAAPFSNTAVQNMRPLIEHRVDEWIAALGEFADSGEDFDASHWGEFLTYDIISELAFGEPLGFIKERADLNHLIDAFHCGLIDFGVFTRMPGLLNFMDKCHLPHWLIHWFTPDAPGNRGISTILKERDRLIDLRISQQGETKAEKPDILNHLLKAHTADPDTLPFEELRRDIFLLMAAGSDTTGSVFRSFVLMLLTHPSAYQRLLTTEFGRDEKRGAKDRPFFQACIKETLRFLSPVTQLFPRKVPDEGFPLPDGRFVPGGPKIEMVGSMVPLSLNKAWFGEDAERWVPERWLRCDKGEVAEMEKGLYTFGYGARVCLGKPVAEVEMEMGFMKLLENFEIRPVDPERPFTRLVDYGVQIHEGLRITLKRR